MIYHRAQTIEELKALLSDLSSAPRILAGGTDMLVEARQQPFQAGEHVVDISRIPALQGISESERQIIIGAMTTHTQIISDKRIRQYATALNLACQSVGSPQIRNRGTVGGNICNASPCADTVPPLMALEAELEIISASGTRHVKLSDIFHKPYRPKLKQGEVITLIRFNKLPPEYRSSFYKLGRRNALAIARINMAAILKLHDDEIIEARLVPGSVFPVWRRVSEAEDFLIGKKATKDVFTRAGEIVAQTMIAISGRRWSTPYKEPVVQNLVKRVLMQAAEGRD